MLSAFHDVLFDRLFDTDELAAGLAEIFEVKPDEILIVAEKYEAPGLTEETPVLCRLIPKPGKGEFPAIMDISPKAMYYTPDDAEKTVEIVCEKFHCRALLGSSHPDPYVSLEISGIGKRRLVSIDPEQANNNCYIVVGYLDADET